MNAIRLLSQSFEDLHRELRSDMAEVSPEMLFWQPAPERNHIGFLFWHLVRDEDNVVSTLTKEPELWQTQDWGRRLGMEEASQGTGLAPEGLAAFRFDPGLFMTYAEDVWTHTGSVIGSMREDALDEPAWPGAEWNVARLVVEGCLCHSWLHLGEIRYAMGLRGWRFRE